MRGEARVVLYLDMSRVLLDFVCEGEFWGLVCEYTCSESKIQCCHKKLKSLLKICDSLNFLFYIF